MDGPVALPSGHLPASALSATPGRGRYVTQANASRDAITPRTPDSSGFGRASDPSLIKEYVIVRNSFGL